MSEVARAVRNVRARWVHRVLGAASLFAIGSHAARAQSVAQLAQRVISANHAIDAANDSVNAVVEEMKLAEMPRDSLKVGGITLRLTMAGLPASTRAVLDRAMIGAWSRVQLGLGDAAARVSARMPVIFKRHPVVNRLQTQILSFELAGRPGAGRMFQSPISVAEAQTGIVDMIGALAAFEEPTILKEYSGEWMPATRLSAENWAEAAIDLATETSAATRDCYAGSVARCESALGLTKVKDPLTEWYSPEDWRVIVSRFPKITKDAPEHVAMLDQCKSGEAPDVCLTLAREKPVARPLVMDTRRTMIALALELGGPKAYDRMNAAKGSSLEILSATAGMGPDELVAEWRRRVLAATPDRVAPKALEVTAMLAWTLAFAALSTRKRP
jgi:hypothetical protein